MVQEFPALHFLLHQNLQKEAPQRSRLLLYFRKENRTKDKKAKRKISISLSSFSSASVNSAEEEKRKRIKRNKIRNKAYKRESLSEDNPLANYYKNLQANGNGNICLGRPFRINRKVGRISMAKKN